MRRLESHDWWPELVALKDEKSLRELAEQFGVTPGAITAALRREGISRTPAPPGPRKNRASAAEVEADSAESRKRGSMAQIEAYHSEVGRVPDDVIADKAGVSRRTVANYRAKHGIAGYRGKRRSTGRGSAVDAYEHLLGTVPDVDIAEKAGVSANAVRAYRVRRGIPSWRSGGPADAAEPEGVVETPAVAQAAAVPVPPPSAAPTASLAWRVAFTDGTVRVVVASSLTAAAARAEAAGDVASVERVGEVLA